MATVSDNDGRRLLMRGKMSPDELQRYLAHRRACAAAARRIPVRRRGAGKGSRAQQRRQDY